MRVRTFVAFGLVAVAVGQLSVGAQPKGTRTTISGEVVDLWCYLEGGDRGPAKKECAIACANAGNPIGVVDAKGNVYIAAGLTHHQPAQTLLLQKMSSRVTLTFSIKLAHLFLLDVRFFSPLTSTV